MTSPWQSSWSSYPKVYNLGHPALGKDFLSGPILIEEKIDGSQFSFGRFDGDLKIRSRRKNMELGAPEALFSEAIAAIQDLDLTDGWTYRGECLQKPKHNVLKYDRIPSKHVILFDVCPAYETYLPYDEKCREADRLGLEVVPRLFHGGNVTISLESLLSLMEMTSVLGGTRIEGVVVKQYTKFGEDGKALFGKHVSEQFKETHQKEWKVKNPSQAGIIDLLGLIYRTESRWQKALQHLAEDGLLTHSPKDIGPIMKEVQKDVLEECEEEIKGRLFKWAWDHLRRMVASGVPEWYKQHLLESQFADDLQKPPPPELPLP